MITVDVGISVISIMIAMLVVVVGGDICDWHDFCHLRQNKNRPRLKREDEAIYEEEKESGNENKN